MQENSNPIIEELKKSNYQLPVENFKIGAQKDILYSADQFVFAVCLEHHLPLNNIDSLLVQKKVLSFLLDLETEIYESSKRIASDRR